MTVVLTGTSLALPDVVRVARGGERVELDAVALERMQASRAVVDAALARGEPVYGFSTGVGMRKLFSIEEDQARFNWLLVRGHLVAQGPAAPDDVVRATLLKLANMLAGGASGARPQLAERLDSALRVVVVEIDRESALAGNELAVLDPRLSTPCSEHCNESLRPQVLVKVVSAHLVS